MEFSKETYNTICRNLSEIEQWCRTNFEGKPKYLRRFPRQHSEDITEHQLGKRLTEFRVKAFFKNYQSNDKGVLNDEERCLIEQYERIKKEYGHGNLNRHGENLLDIEQWCRETFEGKPLYLRHTPVANYKEKERKTERKTERTLGVALCRFRKTDLFQRYSQSAQEELDDAEKELIELYAQIMNEYNYGNLNVHGQNLLAVEQWCRANFADSPKYLRRVPRPTSKKYSSPEEITLSQILSNFRSTDLFHRYTQSGSKSLNKAERQLLDFYQQIIDEYDYGYLNEVGENLNEIITWCQKFNRLPKKITGVKIAANKESETDEQKEMRLATAWNNFKHTNKIYKQYSEKGKDSLNKAEQELIEVFEQIQSEYGDTQRKKAPNIRIPYKGKNMSLPQIAKEEKISLSTLKGYWDRYKNIDKAVYMSKIKQTRQARQKPVTIRKSEINLHDLSIILGIKYSELVTCLNKGMSIEEIKEYYALSPIQKKHVASKKNTILVADDQALLEYCVSHGLNYSFIYRSIHIYGKTLEEATQEYKNNGTKMPQTWIFKKYGLLLKHLLLSMNINKDEVVTLMRKHNIPMEEALEKYIIRRNCKQGKIDSDWMEEVYMFLQVENISEPSEEFKRLFYIDNKEEECIIKSSREIQAVKRKLLLYEIAESIRENIFTAEEVPQLLQMYEITPEEIEIIFLDLYSKFEGGILLGENEPQMKRRQVLNDIVRKWYFLGTDERVQILLQHDVTHEEQQQIEDLYNQIVKHKAMIRRSLTMQEPEQ